MIHKKILIINKLGLHARAAAKLVATTSGFISSVQMGKDDQRVDAKSIMSVMMLAASKGTLLDFEIDGEDEQQALKAIEALINDRFNEGE